MPEIEEIKFASAKDILAFLIARMVEAAMMSGKVTGLEIEEVLEHELAAVKGANKVVLEKSTARGPEEAAYAMKRIYGESKGNA